MRAYVLGKSVLAIKGRIYHLVEGELDSDILNNISLDAVCCLARKRKKNGIRLSTSEIYFKLNSTELNLPRCIDHKSLDN